MNEEDITQFLSAFEDFMKHAEVEEMKHEIRTSKHHVIIDGVEVEIPEENDLIKSLKKRLPNWKLRWTIICRSSYDKQRTNHFSTNANRQSSQSNKGPTVSRISNFTLITSQI